MQKGVTTLQALSLGVACAGDPDRGVSDRGQRPWADTAEAPSGGATGDRVDATLSLREGASEGGWPEVVLVSPALVLGQGILSLNRATLSCGDEVGAGATVDFIYEPAGWWLHDNPGVDVSFVGDGQSQAVELETPLFAVRCPAGRPAWEDAGTLGYEGGETYEPVLLDELPAP